MKNRDVVNVSLAPDAKRRLTKVADHLGMTQQATLGRLIEWFGRQDAVAQVLIMGLVSEADEVFFLELLDIKRHGLWAEAIPDTVGDRLELVGDVMAVLQAQRAKRKREEEPPRPQ